MNVSGIAARVTEALRGEAGSAITSLTGVREMASASHVAFASVVDGSAGPMNAARTLNAVDQVFGSGRLQLRSAVNAAKPGLERVFGEGQPLVSGALHADLGSIASARAILGTAGRDSASTLGAARAGMRSSESVMSAIDGAIPRLEAAAHRSMTFKVGATAIGVGAAIAGVVALRHALQSSGDDGGHRIMAPGPLGHGIPGFDPAFDPTGVVL